MWPTFAWCIYLTSSARRRFLWPQVKEEQWTRCPESWSWSCFCTIYKDPESVYLTISNLDLWEEAVQRLH